MVATTPTVQVEHPGSYSVTVSKTGMTGSGSSAPLVLGRSVDQQDPMNYMIVNNVLKDDVTNPNDIETLAPDERSRSVSYIGGLGNALQTIVSQASPLNKDIVQTTKYDIHGRQLEQYLPYISEVDDSKFRAEALDDGGYTNSEQYDFYQKTNLKLDTDTNPYSKTEVEPSPLQRGLSYTGPGASWHSGNKKVTKKDSLNRASENIRLWKVVSGLPVSSSVYADYQLHISIVKDENGNKTNVYSDKLGRPILKAVQATATEWLRTAFVYNDLGRLAFTITPEGVKAGTLSPTQPFLDQWAFQYKYDPLGRLIEYKAPAGGWIYTVYDKLNRPALTQNADQRSRSEWAFLKYDVYGRPVVTGYKVIASSTRSSVQTSVDGQSFQFELPASNAIGYTLTRTYPSAAETDLLSISYFDNYSFLGYSGWDVQALSYSFVPEQGSTSYNTSVVGLTTGGKIRIIGTTAWLNAVQYYDKWYRPLQVIAENHLGGLERSTNKYNNFRQLAENRLSHHNGALVVLRKMTYDHAGRVTKIHQNINSAPTDQLVAQYEYNELGQLVDKKLHNVSGSNFLQSVDYRYNIRGWIASINNSQLNVNSQSNDETNDYFGMEFLYESAETGLNDQANEQYFNGNTSAIKWKSVGTAANEADQQSYKYKYDRSGRLLTATSQMRNATNWTSEAGAMSESITYDNNGNIKLLQRNHRKHQIISGTPSYIAQKVDSLVYTYSSIQGNQLQKVEDAIPVSRGIGDFKNNSTVPAIEYTYNPDGNLTADKNKGIDSVKYNTLGMVSRVKFSNGNAINYLYDGAGNKLKMTVLGQIPMTTDYVGGFVYESGTLKFFGSPEGRVVKNGSSFEYQYAIADNQGNTRVVFTSATPAVQTADTDFESNPGDLENFPTGGNLSSLPLYNNTLGGAKSQLLNGGYNGQVGIAKSFAVFPGDKVKIDAYAKYEGNNSSSPGAFASALLAAFNLQAPAPGETGTARAGLNGWGALYDGGYYLEDTNAPEAYVNIVAFDKAYNFIGTAYQQVSDVAKQVGVSPDVNHEQLIKEYTVEEEGFVFIYISNNSPVNVYFDDVIISYTPTNIIQYSQYYPFGLQTGQSWTRNNNSNNFLYNAGSELNTNSGWYETFFRGYDAALGRFNQVDPLAFAGSSYSPYNFAFNDPVLYNDPNGDYPDNTYVAFNDFGGGGGGGGGDGMCPTCFVGNEYGGQYTIGYGSGNYWADGMQYSDWSANGGSQMFRDAKANGARLIGGTQYMMDGSGENRALSSQGGQLGYWEMTISRTPDSESSDGYAYATEMVFNAAQQGQNMSFDWRTIVVNIMNSPIMRSKIPDNLTLEFNASSAWPVGGSGTYTVNLLTRGSDAGFHLTRTFQTNYGLEFGFGANVGFYNHNGSVEEITRASLLGPTRTAQAGWFYGGTITGGYSDWNTQISNPTWTGFSAGVGSTWGASYSTGVTYGGWGSDTK